MARFLSHIVPGLAHAETRAWDDRTRKTPCLTRQENLEEYIDHWKKPEFFYKALCLRPLNPNDPYALFCPPLYLGALKDVEAENRRSYRNLVLNSSRAEERKAIRARKYLNSASTWLSRMAMMYHVTTTGDEKNYCHTCFVNGRELSTCYSLLLFLFSL